MSDGSNTERKVTDALAAQELSLWRESVDDRLTEQAKKLLAVDQVLDSIAVHLARIDTNLDWFVKVLKWLVAPLAAIYGGSQAMM